MLKILLNILIQFNKKFKKIEFNKLNFVLFLLYFYFNNLNLKYIYNKLI